MILLTTIFSNNSPKLRFCLGWWQSFRLKASVVCWLIPVYYGRYTGNFLILVIVKTILVKDVYELHGTASLSISDKVLLDEIIYRFAHEPGIRGIFLMDKDN